MTLWIIIGAIGLVVTPAALITLALCAAARIGDDIIKHAHRDEAVSSATLYPTTGRDVQATPGLDEIVALMHQGMSADDAAARYYESRLS